MTIEQLEKANKIRDKIEKLKCFERACKCGSGPDFILAAYTICIPNGEPIYKESKLGLRDYPDLQALILSYISDKIAELENQLEEL